MKKYASMFIASAMYAGAALAQDAPPAQYMPPQTEPAPMMQAPAIAPQPSAFDTGLAQLQEEWAIIKYQTADKDQQEKAISDLAVKAQEFVDANPGRAEPLIWQGIILATKAGIKGGLGALSDAKVARASLEAAEKIDPRALNGSVYTSLGSLYYKVPGWPLGFGDNDKAKAYLEKALAINPSGIDPNFFYGEFLYEQGDYARAKAVLENGLLAPSRPGRELADKGRAEEIRDLLAKVEQKMEK